MSGSDTRRDAYEAVRESGEDLTVRLKVLQAIAEEPRTVDELGRALPHKENAIRPRVDELMRMGCVERGDRRKNPSGHDAYVHHITDDGWRYLKGEIDPTPEPRLAELKTKVVNIAREVVRGNADEDVLQLAVERHDDLKRRLDPEWDGEA